ncbi:hypothetical protein Tco_0782520, partial [Tanacetum coccineum]
MQRPPLFESDSFIYWKNRFETYVKSKDLDLWHVITNGDLQPIEQNLETKLDEVVPFEKQSDDLKKRLAKNNEANEVYSAFRGNTRDLGLFGEETDKITNLHQHLLRLSTQKLETASQITHDTVTTHLKTTSQDLQTA